MGISENQYKLDYKWKGTSITAHMYYCFFTLRAAVAQKEHESSVSQIIVFMGGKNLFYYKLFCVSPF